MASRRIVVNSIATVIDTAVLVIYWVLLSSQTGTHNTTRMIFFSAYLAILACLCVVGAVAKRRTTAEVATLSAAIGNIGAGVVAIASIGLPLVGAGVIQLAVRASQRITVRWTHLLPPAIMLAVLAAGLLTTARS